MDNEILNNLLAWAAREEEEARAQLGRISDGSEVTMSFVDGKMVDTSIATAKTLKRKLEDLAEILNRDGVEFRQAIS
jgi:hypothetical protein